MFIHTDDQKLLGISCLKVELERSALRYRETSIMATADIWDRTMMDNSNFTYYYDTNYTSFDYLDSLNSSTLLNEVLSNMSQTTKGPVEGGRGLGGGMGYMEEVPKGTPEWCVVRDGNYSFVWHACVQLDNPMEMRKPHKANPSFWPILVTHALTFLLGVSGNSIIVASMARDKGTRNVTR